MTRPDLDAIERDIDDNIYAYDGGTNTQPLTDLVAYARELEKAIEDIRGDVYLWRIGEIDAERAMSAIRFSA